MGAGCVGDRNGKWCCLCSDPAKSESSDSHSEVTYVDNPESRARVAFTASHLPFGSEIRSTKVSVKWVSPVTCAGALHAMELSTLIQALAPSLSFRTYVKSTLIESHSVSQLLINLASDNKSLRFASVYLLFVVLTPQMSELVAYFVQEQGLESLRVVVNSDKSDEVVRTIWAIALNCAQIEKSESVIPLFQALINRFPYMEVKSCIEAVLNALKETDEDVTEQLRGLGLLSSVRKLRKSLEKHSENANLLSEIEDLCSRMSRSTHVESV